MEPRIETIKETKLIGKTRTMSLLNNTTPELWRSFMVQRKEIQNNVGTNLYSLQIYDPTYFNAFDANKNFTKWAATEVTDFENVPRDMESLVLPGGLYAVFIYKGDNGGAAKMFQYIFSEWIPNSIYTLDNRPHFELLGEKYKNNDPASEEEIWIPIQLK